MRHLTMRIHPPKLTGYAMQWSCRLLCGILLATSFISMAADKRMPLNHPLRDEGLAVIQSDSPSFVTEILKFLDPDAIAKPSYFLPYSLVIVNNTGRDVLGFTVIY